MAYDETLAARIAARVANLPGVTGQKMFGGVAWMLNGHMFVGVTKSDLMVRADKERSGIRSS